ncbi:MAG: hypothetical protein ACK4I0_12745 [Brevundimonas sp.]|uniref:hypothetical protein n=1 Tax=Brevundimonas sp. TaxID=1871086 RepID=UPI00391980C6
MEPKSINVLDISESLPPGAAKLLDVRFGADSDWNLIARYSNADEAISVVVESPTAFRVTDEGNLIWYWSMLSRQGGPWGFVYELEGSAWLAEYESSAASPRSEVKHYLVAGSDECLEVLSETQPVVQRRN